MVFTKIDEDLLLTTQKAFFKEPTNKNSSKTYVK